LGVEVKCPKCGLANPATAKRCNCGYDLSKLRLVFYNQKGRTFWKAAIGFYILADVFAILLNSQNTVDGFRLLIFAVIHPNMKLFITALMGLPPSPVFPVYMTLSPLFMVPFALSMLKHCWILTEEGIEISSGRKASSKMYPWPDINKIQIESDKALVINISKFDQRRIELLPNQLAEAKAFAKGKMPMERLAAGFER
jgi:hypothetical protein